MPSITPFLWFDDNCDEAIKFYMAIFKNSKLKDVSRYGDSGPGPKGTIMTATFELEGREFMALNGGPYFQFTEAISMFVAVETQAEVDEYYSKLLIGGGVESQCGWLKDRFGLSWQIVPKLLGQLLGDADPVKANRVQDAMMTMKKLDIAGLQRAYDGK